MQNPDSTNTWLTGGKEYRWLPFTYLSYVACVIALMFLIPLDDTLKMQVLILMTTVYIGAIGGMNARALHRIEEKLDRL
jgi:hypothetical protein